MNTYKNFLNHAEKSEMPIQWGYKDLMALKAKTKDHPYWESRIGKYAIRIAEASSDAPKKGGKHENTRN